MTGNLKSLKSLSKEIFSGLPLYGIERMGADSKGVSLINIKDISDGTIRIGDCRKLSLGDFKNASKYLVFPKDVVVTCRGSLLKAAVVPSDINQALITSNLIAIRLGESLLPEFLSIYLNIKEGQKKLLANATSSDLRLVLSVPNVEEFEVPVLPVAVQKQILDLASCSAEQYRLNLEAALTIKQITEQIIEELIRK